MNRDPREPALPTAQRSASTDHPDASSPARWTGQGLTPAQLAAAVAVVRHHADRMASRRQGFEGSRPEMRGER